MGVSLDESLVAEIEAKAADMARQSGEILRQYFRRPLEVEYKDKKEQDPVTTADKESQRYLCEAISRDFPEHGILGEEGPEDREAAAADFLWVLDPLDGTTNFINGLPAYAVSIGVLHRGSPLVGALFIPWPGQNDGLVLHARKGGGSWAGEERVSISEGDGPKANRLAGLPASFGARFRLRKGLRGRVGEVRVTGSIAYELALTTLGGFQYVLFGGPRVWDVAAGAVLVTEAGGAALVGNKGGRLWEPLTTLGPPWEGGRPNLGQIRDWVTPLIAGEAKVTAVVVANLQRRRSLTGRITRLARKLRRA